MTGRRGLAVTWVAGVLAGCVGGAPGKEDGTSIAFTLQGGDFNGNSVYITGTRSPGADSKYRCDSTFEGCFNLDTNATVEISGLCPTEDVPNGTWDFTYEIWSAPDCDEGTGVLLNPGDWTNNFECFDSGDLFTQANINETADESLEPGDDNHNFIACLTYNATKDFAFTSCSVEDQTATTLELDCGCTFNVGTSLCECQHLTNASLQNDVDAACAIENVGTLLAPICRVVCEAVP